MIALHLRGARMQPIPLVSQTTLNRLHTPPTGSMYAGGWGIGTRDWAGGTVLNHNGSNTLWYASVWIAPGIDRAFATVMNRGDQAAQTASNDVIGALVGAYAK